MSHFVYILRSARNGRFYTGFSANPTLRLHEHNTGLVKATRSLGPWEIVYTEEHLNATMARKREYQIKSMKSRRYIESLIDSAKGASIDPL